MSRRLIGYAVTDENGIATVNYTGVGDGELDIVAETGGEVLFDYKGVGGTEKDVFVYNTTDIQVSSSSTGTVVSNISNNGRTFWANFRNTSTDTGSEWNAPFTVEFDVVGYTGTASNIVFQLTQVSSSTTVNRNFNNLGITSNNHIKVVWDGSTVTWYVDGVQNGSSNSFNRTNIDVRFYINGATSFTFKNFIIYRQETPITSSTVKLLDCSSHDSGLYGSAVNQYYLSSTTYLSRKVENDGTVFANSHTSTAYYGFLLPPNTTATSIATSCVYPVQDYCIEVDVVSYGGNVGLDVRGDNGNLISRRFNQLSNNPSFHIRLEVKSGIGKYYIDGSDTATYTSGSVNLNNTFGVRLSVSSGQSVKIKNFKVYPL